MPYDLNPVIVTNYGQVHFCYGIYKPDVKVLSENYKRLGYEADSIFPIKFSTDIEVRECETSGLLDGFLYIERNAVDFFKLTPLDIKNVI